MRIAYLSDLHLEFDRAAPNGAAGAFSLKRALAPAEGADLVVLAGDIDIGVEGVAHADAVARLIGAPAVYVAGNHEAYGHDLAALLPRLRRAAWNTDGRVLFLDCNLARLWIDGRLLVVLDCTLWTDYRLDGDADAAMQNAARAMSDHQTIGWNGGMFQPEQALSLHRDHRAWLAAQMRRLAAETPRPEILVVTHHAPVRQAIGTRAASFAPSYASDMLAEISDWAPLTWIHGHTHLRHVTRIANATIASAPRGYGDGPEGFACDMLSI